MESEAEEEKQLAETETEAGEAESEAAARDCWNGRFVLICGRWWQLPEAASGTPPRLLSRARGPGSPLDVGHVGGVEHGALQDGAGEVGPRQVRPRQVGPGQVRLRPAGDGGGNLA